MKREPERFGWTAPSAPTIPALPKVPMDLDFLVKSDASPEADEPGDPVGQLTAKAQDDAACWKTTATADYAKLVSLLFAPSDVRLAVAPLSKGVGPASDWSWDAPASDTLEKRAHETAKERLRVQLEKFFAGHNDEFWEARGVCDQALDDERAAILANET